MKSPFPGMDPFIEACGLWEDFHHDLIGEIKNSLAQVAPERYVVRTGERAYVVLVESEGKTAHSFLPDVISTEFRESFVEIYALEPERRLVTCIEVLSPSNKRRGTPGWDLYQRKRQGLLLGEANLVEIDLLRGGQRMPMLDPWPEAPYSLLVARRSLAPACRVWPATSLQPLSSIPIPLEPPDADLSLQLQPLIETVYARSRYDRDIDYSRPLTPPLSGEELTWLAGQGKSS